MKFLSLAPLVSDSYPKTQAPARPRGDSTSSDASSRRSSESAPEQPGQRVLRLGPVHWGEHTDEHKDDIFHVPAATQ